MKLDKSKIDKIVKNVRRNIIEVSFHSNKSSHIGGSLSMVEILSTLYGAILKYKVNDPNFQNRDRFILSKGHGALGLYTILYEVGIITKKDFYSYQQNESEFIAHPIMNMKKGIESSNGSLGHGLSMAIGISLAAKINKMNYRTFVLMGDGECNEGSVWEAAMAASHFALDNLFVIVDHNRYQQTGTNNDVMNLGQLVDKWSDFGWDCEEIDGHNLPEIYHALKRSRQPNSPVALIANTIKGKGISFAEEDNAWHHSVLTQKMYELAISELGN